MKTFLSFCSCFLICSMGLSQNRIDIKVNGLDNLNGKYIILSEGLIPFVESAKIIDSVLVNKGKFRFSYISNKVSYYALRIKGTFNFTSYVGKPGDKIILRWITNYPGDITNSVTVIKSTENKVYYRVVDEGKPLILKLNSYIDSASKVETNDTLKRKYYLDQNKYWSDSLNRLYIRMLKAYPKSYASLSALSVYYKKFSDDYIRDYIRNLPAYLKNNELVKKIEYNKFELPAIIKNISGFKDFSFLLPKTDTFKYDGYLGKIVLIDFWASWCVPCISNFPKLEDVKKNFDPTKFEIISVSIDDNFEKWIEGMKKHPSSFVNIYSPGAWESLVVKFFKIQSIPRYVLLGKEGKVLNDNIVLDNLEEEILEALKTK